MDCSTREKRSTYRKLIRNNSWYIYSSIEISRPEKKECKFISNQASAMGCTSSKRIKNNIPQYLETASLASETSFTMNEVEALYVLYKQLSSSIVDDGIIHKVFALFDVKQKGVIEFGDFVRSISIFHPKASQAAKIEFAFNLYDLQHTGYIERKELKEMVLASLEEQNLVISDDLVEAMLDKTFMEVDTKRDGKIDPEEWKEFVTKNPSLMKIMTLQCLKEVTTTFPSFIMNSQVKDSDLAEGENGNFRLYSHRVVPSKKSDGMEETCLSTALKDHNAQMISSKLY